MGLADLGSDLVVRCLGLLWVRVSVEVTRFGLFVSLRVDFESLGFGCLIRLFVLALFLSFPVFGNFTCDVLSWFVDFGL